MKLLKVGKVFLYLFVLSLLIFVVFGNSLIFLLKLLALSTALTIIYGLYLTKASDKVKKGEEVLVIGSLNYLIGKKGIALTTARKNEKIKIKLYDGKEAEGIVEKTEGFFGPAIVRIIYEEELVK